VWHWGEVGEQARRGGTSSKRGKNLKKVKNKSKRNLNYSRQKKEDMSRKKVLGENRDLLGSVTLGGRWGSRPGGGEGAAEGGKS